MGRHIRLKHSTYMCFWRCPVISCSLWFTSELNAKDHIEGIHKFQEGHGTSFYECLRRHGIEWFGSRTFFDQRKATNQAIWMDMALARRSGQELRNSYVITNSTEHAPLRRFFKAAVDALQLMFDRSLVTSVQPKSLLVQMREAVANCDDVSSDGSLMLLSPPHDIPEATLPAESSMDQETRDEISPVVIPRRVTPANRPLQHLEAGRLGASTPQHVRSRPAVPDLCIASSSLLSVIDPLPMDQLSRHTVAEIRAWPAADRHDLLAVANRDVRVARQNIAEMLLYVDDHAAHLANCASADDDTLTLMSAELLPRLEGGSEQRWRKSTIYKLFKFYGRTHKLELYVWVSGHPVTLPIEISRHFLYIYDCNHGINVYMVDRFIVYVFYIRFLCQVLCVQVEHQDLSIYSQILSLLIYHSVTFSYIYIVIVSGYSYYVNMLVTRLKSDMCLVFLLHN